MKDDVDSGLESESSAKRGLGLAGRRRDTSWTGGGVLTASVKVGEGGEEILISE